MGATRWVVIGTALVAAATAFHLLLSPDGGRRAVSTPEDAGRDAGIATRTSSPATGFDGASRETGTNGRTRPPGGPPQEELDAASRDAMRSFLRQSAQDEK